MRNKLEYYQFENKHTDQQMADNIGISRQYYMKLRKGEVKNPTIETILKIEKATGLTIEDYLELNK
jgi:transcriptional regulator with XRE-family HTH domain